MSDRKRNPPKKPEAKTATTRRSSDDKDALRDAFAGVTPLGSPKKRVMPAQDDRPTRPSPVRRQRKKPAEDFAVIRDPDGSVVGRRPGTHASILDALEDPRLEFDARCDLHGRTVAEAERDVLRFLRESHADGDRWVLIIVGKGLHSPDGKATLRTHIADALSRGAPSRFVLAFRTAPRRHGGTGALAVRLIERG
ncbi:MAG: Smr/MutS family protein [Polyangiales bacterium]